MVIGDKPSQEDDSKGVLFQGSSGALLDSMLAEAGIDRKTVYSTTAIACTTKSERNPSSKELLNCTDKLEQEIKMCSPKVIITVGNVALKRVLNFSGVLTHQGKIYKSEKYQCVVVPIVDPVSIFKNKGRYKEETITYLKRAKEQTSKQLVTPDFSRYKILTKYTEVLDFLHYLKNISVYSHDNETTGLDFMKDKILGKGFCVKQNESYYLPFIGKNKVELWTTEEKMNIRNVLTEVAQVKATKISHNGSFDYKFDRFDLGVDLSLDFCTMQAAHLLDENRPLGLKSLAMTYTNLGGYEAELQPYIGSGENKDFSLAPIELLAKYCCIDCEVTLQLFHIFTKQLEDQGLSYLFKELVMPLRRALTELEMSGVKVNSELLEKFTIETSTKLEVLDKKIKDATSIDFNVRSNKQLQELLFSTLKLPVQKKTESGQPSTDEESLSLLKGKHPLIESILEYKTLEKLHSTYFLPMKDFMDTEGRIHTSYKATTTTGRTSSAKPNLQNIPSDSNIRSLFVPTSGCKFVIFDYSQMEVRILAQYSRDETLLTSFEKDLDTHTEVASKIFKMSVEDIKALKTSPIEAEQKKYKMMRDTAKTTNFGVIYGIGAKGLASQLSIGEDEAQNFLNVFYKEFPGIRNFQNNTHGVAFMNKSVRSIFGRVRHLPDMGLVGNTYGEKYRKSLAERQSVNSLIQGTASDCLSIATIKIGRYIRENNLKSRIVLTVHDELVFEVPESEILTLVPAVKNIMEHPSPVITIPLKVDISIGDSWGDKLGGLSFEDYRAKFLQNNN